MYVDLMIIIKMLIAMSAYLWAVRPPAAAFDRLVLTVLFFFCLRPSRSVGYVNSVIVSWSEGFKDPGSVSGIR